MPFRGFVAIMAGVGAFVGFCLGCIIIVNFIHVVIDFSKIFWWSLYSIIKFVYKFPSNIIKRQLKIDRIPLAIKSVRESDVLILFVIGLICCAATVCLGTVIGYITWLIIC